MSAHAGHNMGHAGSTMSPVSTMDHAAMGHGSMNHGGMDHSQMGSTGMPPMDHMMKMYFHTGYNDIVLFENWVMSDIWSLLATCFGFFVLGILYEGLKAYREHLIKAHIYTARNNVSIVGSDSPMNGINDRSDTLPRPTNNRRCPFSRIMWSCPHIVQTILHVVQGALGYALMLAFMAFNVWLCLAILLGSGAGYFIFCWRKITVMDATGGHCYTS